MIIDAHVHLPVCNEGHSLQRQKEHIQFVKKLGLKEGIEKRVFERNAVEVYSLNM